MDKSFAKGLILLEALAASGESRGVSDLARELDITKSNAHRLLQTLVSTGFAEPGAERGTYRASLKMWRLGTGLVDQIDLRQVALPRMRALLERIGETVHLSIIDERWMVYIERVESKHYVRTYAPIGLRSPAHCSSTGKVLLAHASDKMVQATAADLTRYTERTITDRAEFLAQIETVRRRGWASTHAEWHEGVVSIAAPVRDARGNVVAALGITGPHGRLKPSDVPDVAPIVVETADSVSVAMGWTPKPPRGPAG